MEIKNLLDLRETRIAYNSRNEFFRAHTYEIIIDNNETFYSIVDSDLKYLFPNDIEWENFRRNELKAHFLNYLATH